MRGYDANISFSPIKINVIVGRNGQFKTTLLEVLSAALILKFFETGDVVSANKLMKLTSLLRGDEFWFHRLISYHFELEVNEDHIYGGPVLKEDEEILNKLFTPNLMTNVGYLPPIKVYEIKVNDLITKVNIFPNGLMGFAVNKQNPNAKVYRFIPLSSLNLISPEYFSIMNDLVHIHKLFEVMSKVKVFESLEFKNDEFNRFTLIATYENKEVPVYYLGGGYYSLALTLIGSTLDIALFDSLENNLHPGFMMKIAEIIRNSPTQWFITTQSEELLDILLDHIYDIQVIRLYRSDNKIRSKVINKGDALELRKVEIDLRG